MCLKIYTHSIWQNSWQSSYYYQYCRDICDLQFEEGRFLNFLPMLMFAYSFDVFSFLEEMCLISNFVAFFVIWICRNYNSQNIFYNIYIFFQIRPHLIHIMYMYLVQFFPEVRPLCSYSNEVSYLFFSTG